MTQAPAGLSLAEFLELLNDPEELERPVTDHVSPLTVVDLPDGDGAWGDLPSFVAPPWRVLVGRCRRPPAFGGAGSQLLDGFDVLLTDGDEELPGWVRPADAAGSLQRIGSTCRQAPMAAATMVQLLRIGRSLPLAEAFVAESLAYSMLLAGPEFKSWCQGRRPATPHPSSNPVVVDHDGATLTVTLNRPEVRNAYSAELRDALVDVLRGAVASPNRPHVVLRGNGPSFCSGGDLAEFETAPDPVTAHAIRTSRSPGLLLAALGEMASVRVHGACVGAGTELPAFCSRVEAASDTTFRLPELAMGLLPGAGGTASLPRRIGRPRTAYLALTGEELAATTALRWGLVDEIVAG